MDTETGTYTFTDGTERPALVVRRHEVPIKQKVEEVRKVVRPQLDERGKPAVDGNGSPIMEQHETTVEVEVETLRPVVDLVVPIDEGVKAAGDDDRRRGFLHLREVFKGHGHDRYRPPGA